MNKGAMFGLDARIALAIFGALSVISGAALYSAIQESKVTALLVDMQELAKAYESYLIDTGSELPTNDVLNHNSAVLVNPSILPKDGYKGPYISYPTGKESTAPHDMYVNYSQYNAILFFSRLKSGDFPSSSTLNNIITTYKCTDSSNCSMYVSLRAATADISNSILKSLDILIDGTDSRLTGNFKYVYDTGSTLVYTYYKVRPVTDISDGVRVY